ncbi:MAG TPA: hypothetical protein VJ325_01325, partial [Thiobacillus sp.]|nr:hypothetical protein [Thiobacillus sp.]
LTPEALLFTPQYGARLVAAYSILCRPPREALNKPVFQFCIQATEPFCPPPRGRERIIVGFTRELLVY